MSFKHFLVLLTLTTASLGGANAVAQTADEEESDKKLEEIIVSASRLRSDDFEASTPVRSVAADDIANRGAGNAAGLVQTMPGFNPRYSQAGSRINSRSNGATSFDFRGLGANRSLTLINGRRVAPLDGRGLIDASQVPSIAIGNIEVVSGGSSAAWGSESVAGVINFLYDTELRGGKVEFQRGGAAEGDADSYRIGAIYADEFDQGSGNFLVAAEYFDDQGVVGVQTRDWQTDFPCFINNPANTSSSDGIPRLIRATDCRNARSLTGGVTFGQPAAINNLVFNSDGTTRPRVTGVGFPGANMVGGDGVRYSGLQPTSVPIERISLLGLFERDLSDNLSVFFESSFSRLESDSAIIPADERNSIIINSGNPYLPASVQAAMDANAISTFRLSRAFEDTNPLIGLNTKSDALRMVLGLKGDIGNDWQWDIAYQYAENERNLIRGGNFNRELMNRAADAVIDPSTGNIVCAAVLSGVDPDCIPVNFFGAGNIDPASEAYFRGSPAENIFTDQTIVNGTVSGDLFEAWAGTVPVVFGFDYREESLTEIQNSAAEQGDLRTGNGTSLAGEFDVVDLFGEIGVPLVSGDQELDLNAAVRWTDNSLADDAVITWKAGLTYRPTESLLLRGTVSRDARSPSISEVFLNASSVELRVFNPFTGTDNNFGTLIRTGNPFLVAEEADNFTAGIVYQPEFAELSLSVDWFRTELTDAIESSGAQAIVDRCFAGDTNFCRLITFNATNTNEFDSIIASFVNLGVFDVEGFDFGARYTRDLVGGQLTLNYTGTFYSEKTFGLAGDTPQDVVGQVGEQDQFRGVPEFNWNLVADYSRGQWGVNGRVRYISESEHDVNWTIEDVSPEDNKVDSIAYLDLSARYNMELGDNGVELYFGINNVLDEDPPVVTNTSPFTRQTANSLYDVVGRRYYAGVRARF